MRTFSLKQVFLLQELCQVIFPHQALMIKWLVLDAELHEVPLEIDALRHDSILSVELMIR